MVSLYKCKILCALSAELFPKFICTMEALFFSIIVQNYKKLLLFTYLVFLGYCFCVLSSYCHCLFVSFMRMCFNVALSPICFVTSIVDGFFFWELTKFIWPLCCIFDALFKRLIKLFYSSLALLPICSLIFF